MSDQRNLRRLDEKRLENQSGVKPTVVPAGVPKSDHPTCMSCRFMFDCGPNPQDITKHVIECRWGPPSGTTIPMGGGIARLTSAPQPPPDYWCHRHEVIEAPALVTP